MRLPPLHNVIELKVAPRDDDGPELVSSNRTLLKCQHPSFEVDGSLAEVTCQKCGEKLNPMWVLERLANTETRWHESRARYKDEMERLSKRERTKCQHCRKMTRIS